MKAIIQIMGPENQMADRINSVPFKELPKAGDMIRIDGRVLWVSYICHEFEHPTGDPSVAVIVKEQTD